MKKLLIILGVFLLALKADAAMSFSDAFDENNTKPMAVLVYADWMNDYENYLATFRGLEREFGNTYNFVEVNIASEDAKDYLERSTILVKPPYIMLYRGKCKFARVIERDFANDSGNISQKMKTFIRQ